MSCPVLAGGDVAASRDEPIRPIMPRVGRARLDPEITVESRGSPL